MPGQENITYMVFRDQEADIPQHGVVKVPVFLCCVDITREEGGKLYQEPYRAMTTYTDIVLVPENGTYYVAAEPDQSDTQMFGSLILTRFKVTTRTVVDITQG